MKYLFTILFFAFFSANPLTLHAQMKMVKKIPIEATHFAVDQLGNIYAVSDNQLIKYHKQQDYKKYVFSTNQYGDITSIDVTNPYKILVFFQDFTTVLLLDNVLSITGNAINLQRLNLEQSTLVSMSHNNGIWTYNSLRRELIRLNEQLTVTVETGNLEQILNLNLNPNFLLEYNNNLYLNNPKTGILVFDIYGTYIKTLPFKNLENFQVMENGILFPEGDTIIKYNFKTLETKRLKTKSENILKAFLIKDLLYLHTENTIELYNLH